VLLSGVETTATANASGLQYDAPSDTSTAKSMVGCSHPERHAERQHAAYQLK